MTQIKESKLKKDGNKKQRIGRKVRKTRDKTSERYCETGNRMETVLEPDLECTLRSTVPVETANM